MSRWPFCLPTGLPTGTLPMHSLCMTGVFHKTDLLIKLNIIWHNSKRIKIVIFNLPLSTCYNVHSPTSWLSLTILCPDRDTEWWCSEGLCVAMVGLVCVAMVGLTCAHWLLNVQQGRSLTQPQGPISLTRARWGCLDQTSPTHSTLP